MGNHQFRMPMKYDAMGYALSSLLGIDPARVAGASSDFHRDLEGSMALYNHVFTASNSTGTLNMTFEASKQVKDHLDPTGCHQCFVLRTKYVKMAGLKQDEFTGSKDVELVRCPAHQREYIQGIKKQLTEAIEKIGK